MAVRAAKGRRAPASGQAVTPADRAAVARLGRALATLDLDQPSGLPTALEQLRALLDVDLVVLYGLRTAALELEAWYQAGGPPGLRAALAAFLESASDLPPFLYDPARPPAELRDRVGDVRAWSERQPGGGWPASRMCREVLAPLGLDGHHIRRVLFDEEPGLLGWFGTLSRAPATRRQEVLLAHLFEPVRARMSIERRLGGVARIQGAFEAGLERLGAAAFVVGAHGKIHDVNAAGRDLLSRDGAAIGRALEAALAGRTAEPTLELHPLRSAGVPTSYLAIRRVDPAEARLAACVQQCRERWRLTPRQAQVLPLVVRGLATATIADMLGTGPRAIELHVTALLERAGVESRAALVSRVLTEP